MNFSLIDLCVENAKKRVKNAKNKMSYSSYISYFVRRYNLTIADDEEIRKQIKKYIDDNSAALFPTNYTINGAKIRK
jgi:hypothetical protein